MNSYETVKKVLEEVSEGNIVFSIDKPEDIERGDYATNIAFPLSKAQTISPKECAEDLKPQLEKKLNDIIAKIEIAGPGFINIFLKDEVRTKEAEQYIHEKVFTVEKNGHVIVEYTDPNPFKLFHIGHLVPNAIGESIARLYEAHGKNVTRVCYQGDVGIHVASTVYAIQQKFEERPGEDVSLFEKVSYLGRAYAYGTQAYEDESKKALVVDINKKISSREDENINSIYDYGKKVSLEYFETMYNKLGTKFDYYIMESEVAERGKEIVKANIGNVFEESDGAVVYKGEKVGLHTRVFINSDGIPTYEAKELGNTYKKKELVPNTEESLVVTGNEINEYFKVVKSALGEIDKELADSIKHISHGMLRLPEGKMSSRTGNIIPAEELIDKVKEHIVEKLKDAKKEGEFTQQLLNDIAVGSIKFAILKSAPGKDMVFDFEKSLSFEGDSGPYLQYTHARLATLLEKAISVGIGDDYKEPENSEKELEQVITKYPLVLEKAFEEIGPHHIVQYLLSLTRIFNNMYARVHIVDESNRENSAYYVMLSKATKNVLSHGLHVLGIVAPERM